MAKQEKTQQATTVVDEQSSVKLDEALTAQPTGLQTTKTTGKAVTEYEETGFEHMTQADFKVPFISVLQALSPQVQEGNPKQVAGAKAGSFINSVSQEVFDGRTGIVVTPVHSIHQYLEWIPRDDGGGLVSVYDWQDPKVIEAIKKAGKRFGKIPINDNNELQESFNVFCLQHLSDGRRIPIVMGFASSQIGAYQMWMTNAKSQTREVNGAQLPRPLWSHRYRITTLFNQNKKGAWHKMTVAFDGPTAEAARIEESDPITAEAKEFRNMLLAGTVQANFESVERHEGDSGDDSKYDM